MTVPVPRLVIFDLDHTLVHVDSFAGFNCALIARQWWRIALALLALPVAAPLALFRATRTFALSICVWLGTVGLDRRALDALMDDYVQQRFGAGRLSCARAVQALLAHRAAGARVLVATGCETELAERVCRAIGLGEIEVVGSLLRPWCHGWIGARHCHGPRKLEMLREKLACRGWDCVYTDSAADLPILRHGARRFLVNPTPAARRKIAAALGAGFEIMDWGAPRH